MVRAVRWLAAGALGIGCLSSPQLAAAREPYFSDGEGAVLLVAFLSDVTFTVVDAVAAANDSRHNAWVIPQAVLSTPQAILLGVVEYDDNDFIPVALPIVINQLTAFASYGLASQRVSTTALYGLSWGIGANAALTNNAVAAATAGNLFVRPSVAITELAFAVPQLAVVGYALHSPQDFPRQRAAVLTLGVWSSALFVHGVLSLALYRAKPRPTPQAWHVFPSLIGRELGPAPAAGPSNGGAPGLVVRGVF